MQFHEHRLASLTGCLTQTRYHLAIERLDPPAIRFVWFGEKSDHLCAIAPQRIACWRMCSSHSQIVLFDLAHTLEVITLHFAFGQIGCESGILDCHESVQSPMMKCHCRNVLLTRQQEWNPRIWIR